MAIQFACPNCGRQLRVPDSAVGKESQCPKCSNVCEVSELYSQVPDFPAAVNPYASPMQPIARMPQALVADKNVRAWAMAGHLLGLSAAIVPFGNIIGPLAIWLMKRDEMPFAAEQAKESLNFQITLMLSLVVFGIAGLFTCGLTWIVMIVAAIGGIVFPIIAGIKANDGEPYRYPCTMRLL